MTTIARRAQTVNHYTTAGATKSIVIDSSVQAGDLLVLAFVGGAAPDATPSGWTPLQNGTSNNVFVYVYTRVATSGDPGATVTIAAASSSKTSLGILAYRGTSTSGPVSLSAKATYSGADTATFASGSVVSTITGWLVRIGGLRDAGQASTTYTLPASMSTIIAEDHTGGTTGTVLLASDSNGDLAAGTYGGNWVVTDGGYGSHAFVGVGISIAPTSTTTVVRPIADITTDSAVTNPLGLSQFDVLDDDDPTTYVETPAGGTTLEWKLGAMSSAPNVISVKGYSAGGSITQQVTTYLIENATVKATWGPETSLVTSETEYRYTLTAPQQASLSDLTNLRVRQTTVMS